jgi:hypothetical protein
MQSDPALLGRRFENSVLQHRLRPKPLVHGCLAPKSDSVRRQISRANLLKKIVGAAGVREITGSIAISALHYWKFAVGPFGEDGHAESLKQ